MKLFCRHQPCFEKQCCVGFVFTGVSTVCPLWRVKRAFFAFFPPQEQRSSRFVCPWFPMWSFNLLSCQSTLFRFAANLGICIQWPNNKEWHWTAFTIPVLVESFESHQWLCVSRVLNVLCIESTQLKLLLLHLLLLWSPLCVRPALQMYLIFLIFEQLVQYLDSNSCCV